MSGFTIGEQTIFKNLYRMRAGSYILYDYKKNNFKNTIIIFIKMKN